MAVVTGRLQIRNWQDKDGKEIKREFITTTTYRSYGKRIEVGVKNAVVGFGFQDTLIPFIVNMTFCVIIQKGHALTWLWKAEK